MIKKFNENFEEDYEEFDNIIVDKIYKLYELITNKEIHKFIVRKGVASKNKEHENDDWWDDLEEGEVSIDYDTLLIRNDKLYFDLLDQDGEDLQTEIKLK